MVGQQRVFIGGAASERMPAASKVPQEEVIRTLFFVIHINDNNIGHINFFPQFADDTKICNLVLVDSKTAKSFRRAVENTRLV